MQPKRSQGVFCGSGSSIEAVTRDFGQSLGHGQMGGSCPAWMEPVRLLRKQGGGIAHRPVASERAILCSERGNFSEPQAGAGQF